MTSADSPAAHGTVGALFARRPWRWGLRGDVYLWQEMEQNLADVSLPSSLWDLRNLLESSWREAVGVPLSDSAEPIYIQRFDPGSGMSAGAVLPAWWNATGLPILLDRFDASNPAG
ncbi:hypothetical protein ACFSBZ_12795 [Amnibacterium flavum]|uniref:Uncharacterized protein n=1 Tax=Amnibacterium flavum TaxID=2173173 RepID=A0A2V1HSS8_9MICO|nr:hypothetical protein [Amnibacterium flavum]PVZ95655.1 hypothetical protein DDQ50_04005 [Amnibacterium flavum]